MSELKPCPFCGGQIARTDCEGDSYANSFYCDKCPVEFTVPHHTTDAAYVAIWNTRTPPSLPPVSPEDLVEGEWYVVRYGSPVMIFQQIGTPTWRSDFGLFIFMLSGNAYPANRLSIYGPLKFKIGGAE